MLHSILITGGNKEDRFKKALEIRNEKNNLSTFNNDPDFLLLEPPNLSIGIAQIKELKTRLSRKPFQNPYKIAFVPQAEKLTLPAQNALLKLLEEPPAQTVIILALSSPDSLLPTIQSRCQLIQLAAKAQIDFSREELAESLQFIINLIKNRAGERLLRVQPYLKDRGTAIEFCQKTIVALHPKLAQFAKVIKSLQNSLSLIQQNVNPKLVMENMTLQW